MLGAGRGMGSWCLMDEEFPFGEMTKLLEVDGGDGGTTVWVCLMSLNYILKNA